MNKNNTRIVLITSGQPSLNPRLVKEADALVAEGYEVFVIYQFWNQWGTNLDNELLAKKKWKSIRVGGDPIVEKFKYLKSKIIHQIGKLIVCGVGFKHGLAELALSRSTNALIKKAKSIPASMYIAHNLGALPAAVLASQKNNAKCGFDAEDFHRQESTDDLNSNIYQLAKFIEDKYITKVDYLTASAPLIASAYHKLYPSLSPVIINNVFSLNSFKNEREAEAHPTEELKLFWFSQTIGKNRGIEGIIIALAKLQLPKITLTLLGMIRKEDRSYFERLAAKENLPLSSIKFLKPVKLTQIFAIAAKHDLGLALEPGFYLNNKLALSNKLFAYLVSGIGVIASETDAQKQFLKKYPKIGSSFQLENINRLAEILSFYYHNRNALSEVKFQAKLLAKTELNWESESIKFIHTVSNTLKACN